MTIALSEAHRELQEVVRSFAAAHKLQAAARANLEVEREAPPEYWLEAAALGWLGLHLPEGVGGSGFGLLETAIVVEELGRVLAPGPFLPSVVASAVIDAAGSEEQRRRLLPGLADGSRPAALGLGGSLTLGPEGWGGDAGIVLCAEVADLLLLVAGEDVLVVPAAAAGVRIETVQNVDLTRRSSRVTFEGVATTEVERLAGARPVALASARALAAAEASGGAQACLESATQYAKDRRQFGRIIGSFQAVKHHCANMLVDSELATAAAWDAARAGRAPQDQASFAGAVAVTQAMGAFVRNAQRNIQIHGGIGFTWEHDGHLFLRRAAALHALFDPTSARSEVTELSEAGVRRAQAVELPPEAEAIREEVRQFAESVKDMAPAEQLEQMIETGFGQPHWPRPWGREAPAVEQLVIDEEFARAGISRPEYGITGWVILTLIQHGSEEQVARWVLPTLRRQLSWCQLFSEPDAGSDAAGIRTRATRTDGGFIVNGQKVWTSGAKQSDRGLATVRTDPDAPKHAGITAVVIDMHAEGVEVRPLREATGNALFNEVFFNDVFVPDEDVVGPVNGGWTVARSTLGNERISIGRGTVASVVDLLAFYRRFGDRVPGSAGPVGELLAEAQAMTLLNLRRAERAVAGGEPGPEGNVTKLLSAEHVQRVGDLALSLAGPDAALAEGDAGMVGLQLVFSRALTIAGGTSEITRNQIAERILGLPRDPLLS